MKHLLFFCFTTLAVTQVQAQEQESVDFLKLSAEVKVLPEEAKVNGKVAFLFDVLEPTDSIAIDARKMEVDGARLNGEPISLGNDGKHLWLTTAIVASKGNILEFTYSANPSQTMYFVGWDSASYNQFSPQVWTQGQGKETSHWLPSFDEVTEKLEFDLSFILPEDLTVISNGKLVSNTDFEPGFLRWEFNMERPMSSYLVAVAAGQYYKDELLSESKVVISNYFYPGDEDKVEPTFRYTKTIFDFLEKEIGVPFPWQNYKQLPVRDFLHSGMENTTTTIFSDIFITDSIGFFDRNYVMVNAHELSHQWFGNAVTAASPEHQWLQEGFATYFALLAEREVFGDDYYYWKLFQTAEQLKAASDIGKGEAVMNPKAGSLTLYQKGALALHILRERVGKEAFSKAVQSYLGKYLFKSVTTYQFLAEMEAASGQDLSDYKKNWLEQSAFQGTEALNSLRKSKFINEYLAIAALRETPLKGKKESLLSALNFPVNDYIGQEVVQQLALENSVEVLGLYNKAFDSNNLFVRQAIALSLEEVPQDLKSEFESLLRDASYVTKEAALYKLWMNFPAARGEYLDQAKAIDGLSDKNVRTLWLALNLATPDYEPAKKAGVYQELSGYTGGQYPFYIRENGFRYLYQLNSFSDSNLQDLLEGTQHPVYRFRKFCRDLLKELLSNQTYQVRLEGLKEELPQKQKAYLSQLLEK